MKNNLPTFIGIGAGKSGTTWLYSILNEHPEICMSSAKETLFFNSYYQRGINWYSKFFKQCNCQNAIGEVSNTYIFSSLVPARIYEFNSNIQLIATLRNPADRAFSHYLFHCRNAQFEGTFEDAIAQKPDLIERGLYFHYLSNYLEYFQRKQLLILLFDDLKANPIALGQKIFNFLGVDPNWATPDLVQTQRLPASKPRNKVLAKIVKGTALMMRQSGLPQAVTTITKIKSSPIVNLLYKPYERNEYPKMKPETRQKLNDYFRDDVRKLSPLVNRDLETLWLHSSDE
jgi:hypothetical protein